MKTRESGMPDEATWASFFEPDKVLDKLLLASGTGDVVEFGCGYGTFTTPAARRSTGAVYAFDIEPEMIQQTARKAHAAHLANVRTILRDFAAEGTGLASGSVDYAMLFNLLHAENPWQLLDEAWRILRPRGRLGIMHWNFDSTTPRGPSLDIRPRPQQCRDWSLQTGFLLMPPGIIDLPPYHYGMVFERPA